MVVLKPAQLPQTTSSLSTSFSPQGARAATSVYTLLSAAPGEPYGVKAGDQTLAPKGLSGALTVEGLSGTASFRIQVDGVPVVERALTAGQTLYFARTGLSPQGTHTITVAWRCGDAPATLSGFDAAVLSVTADDFGTDVKDPGDG